MFDEMKDCLPPKIVEYGLSSKYCGMMDKPDAYAKITGPCGDTDEIYLQIKQGVVEDGRFLTDGCIFSIAACHAATRMALGKTVRECMSINQQAILDHLHGALPEDHGHCALLAANTLQDALWAYIDCAVKAFKGGITHAHF